MLLSCCKLQTSVIKLSALTLFDIDFVLVLFIYALNTAISSDYAAQYRVIVPVFDRYSV